MSARRAPTPIADTDRAGAHAARAALASSQPRHGVPPAPVAMAARTAAAVAYATEGLGWPWWLDRQLRPTHAAFVPVGRLGAIENLTGRSWVTLATLTSGPLAVVDPAGALYPLDATWSLDWVIGAEDRWHRPAVETTVRQRLVSHAPVVETACKVPSGDAVARAYAITTGDGDAVVVEIENDSTAPFVALFAVRPTGPLGAGAVTGVTYEHPHVLVDERPALVFEKRPARWATADAPDDAVAVAMAGAARDDAFEPVRSTTGLATAAFLLPVAHRSRVRVLVFPRAGRRDRPALRASVPAAGQVARGWETHVAAAARVELPDRRVSDAYASALRAVAAAAVPNASVPLGRSTWGVAEEAALVRALARVGLAGAAGALLAARGDELELVSWFRREPASIERNLAIFETIGAYWAATADTVAVDAVLPAAVKAAHWTERARSRRASAVDPVLARAAEAALAALARAVRACGQPEAADDLDAFAARFVLDLDVEGTAAAGTAGTDLGVESVVVDGHTAPGGRAPVVEGCHGIDTVATLRAALDDVANRDPLVFDRIEWVLRAGAVTGRWPTFVHPSLVTGSGDAGDDPLAAALVLELARALVLDEDSRANTLLLLPVVPPSWYGQSVDVHDLPTRHGVLSFALRWHGTRPALLWELTRRPGSSDEPVTIAVPGLDAAWSTTAASGEALLAAPPHAEQVAVVAHPDTDHVPMTTLEPRVRREPIPETPVAFPAPAEPGDSFD